MARIPVVTLRGEQLAQLLRKRLFTREMFAERAEVSPQTIAAATNGERIRLTSAHKIAKALRVPLATLVSDPTPDLPARAIG